MNSRQFARIFLLVVLFQNLTAKSEAQDSIPRFIDIAREYFSKYSYESMDGLYPRFARRPRGWFVDLIERNPDEKLVISQPFWTIENRQFEELPLVEKTGSLNGRLLEMARILNEDAYGYERCVYFGYPGWAADLIRDFGQGEYPVSDTLLEGLGRAYSYLSQTYGWHQMGGPANPEDSLQRKLGPTEFPDSNRWKKIDEYSLKSIEAYRELARRNPRYLTRVGNVRAKMINEQLSYYLTLLIGNRNADAARYLTKIKIHPAYRQYAINLLQSCPPNSILIAEGDHNFYSILYVQATENIRKDITLVSREMLNFAPYISYLNRRYPGLHSLTNEFLSGPAPEVFFNEAGPMEEYEEDGIEKSVSTLVDELLRSEQTVTFENGAIFNAFSANRMTIPVHSDYWKNNYKRTIFKNEITWNLPEILLLQDLVIFDLIRKYWEKRPICITNENPQNAQISHFETHGLVYWLLPSGRGLFSTAYDYPEAIEYYTKYYKPAVLPPDHPDYFGKEADIAHLYVHDRLIQYLVGKNDIAKGQFYSKKYLEVYKNFRAPFMPEINEKIAHSIMRSEMETEGIHFLEDQAETLYQHYKQYSSVHGYYPRNKVQFVLGQYKILLKNRKLRSEKIDSLVTKMATEK